MSDYEQTRDAAGKAASQYDKMLRNLDDEAGPPQKSQEPMRPPARSKINYCVDETRKGRNDE